MPQLTLGPLIIPQNASVPWTRHPIGLIYEDSNEGRKPLGLVVSRRFDSAAAEWKHSDVGSPDADEDLLGMEAGGGGSGRGGDRIITCQLHVKQQSSGRWSCSNRTPRFPVSFYWTLRAAVPGA